MERWSGKVAVVTGASSGIGEAIARDLTAQGLKVAALARRVDRLKAMESELSGTGVIKGIQCDITKDEDISNAFKWIEENWGGVHVMINNAGYYHPWQYPELDIEKLKQMFGTNFIGLATCMKEALNSMRSHGIVDGHIININSIAGHMILPFRGTGGYAATKHALRAFTEHTRMELGVAKLKTKVTSISPGVIETEMTADYLKNNESPYIAPSAIAQGVIYALSTPPNLNVTELTIEPVGEQFLHSIK